MCKTSLVNNFYVKENPQDVSRLFKSTTPCGISRETEEIQQSTSPKQRRPQSHLRRLLNRVISFLPLALEYHQVREWN